MRLSVVWSCRRSIDHVELHCCSIMWYIIQQTCVYVWWEATDRCRDAHSCWSSRTVVSILLNAQITGLVRADELRDWYDSRRVCQDLFVTAAGNGGEMLAVKLSVSVAGIKQKLRQIQKVKKWIFWLQPPSVWSHCYWVSLKVQLRIAVRIASAGRGRMFVNFVQVIRFSF